MTIMLDIWKTFKQLLIGIDFITEQKSRSTMQAQQEKIQKKERKVCVK